MAAARALSWNASRTSCSCSPSLTSNIELQASPSYISATLSAHNTHRQNCSVPDLAWSDLLAGIAQQTASSCFYGHDTQTGGGGYGQNIGAGVAPDDIDALITTLMYDDEIGYFPLPYGKPDPDMTNFELWGHYSQIVWKATSDVGCFTQYCPQGLKNTSPDVSPYFTVCNYMPPGNYAGGYGENVLPPRVQ